ncbi:MAG: hypothetical protein ACRDKX_06985, partial [Solirubrobacterales bacterium]
MRRKREHETHREVRRAERRARRIAAGAGAALGASVVFAPIAQAATFEVDTTDDEPDDGACLDDDCTLREAVNDADQSSGDDVVTFAAGLSGEIDLVDGDINIGGDGGVEIQGPGADVLAIDGQDDQRIFKITGFPVPNEQVVISGLTLTGGNESDPTSDSGGAIRSFGTIDPGTLYEYPADLTVRDSVLTDNETGDDGGAIYNEPVYVFGSGDYYSGGLTIQGSVITDNEAGDDGGAIDSRSNGYGPVAITDSVISGNRANYVGGVRLDDLEEPATITRSTVSNNIAVGSNAGGIGVSSYEETAGLTI